MRRVLLFVVLLVAGGLTHSVPPAGAQSYTWPDDTRGRPAAQCSYIDTATGRATLCSDTSPLPITGTVTTSGGGTGGSTSTTDTTAFGRQWYPIGTQGGRRFLANAGVGGCFVDATTVVAFQNESTSASYLRYWRSNDGGQVWEAGGFINRDYGDGLRPDGSTTLCLDDGSVVWAQNGGSASRGLWYATDIGGQAVSATVNPTGTVNGIRVMHAVTGGTVLAIENTANPQTWITTDYGRTWTRQAADADLNGTTLGWGALTSPVAGTWLLSAYGGSGGAGFHVYVSTDNGLTWALRGTIDAAAGGSAGGIACFTATVCVAAGGSTIYRSTDAGVTWAAVWQTTATLDLRSVRVFTSTTGLVRDQISTTGLNVPNGFVPWLWTGDAGLTWASTNAIPCNGTAGDNEAWAQTIVASDGSRAVGFFGWQTSGGVALDTACSFYSPSSTVATGTIRGASGVAVRVDGTGGLSTHTGVTWLNTFSDVSVGAITLVRASQALRHSILCVNTGPNNLRVGGDTATATGRGVRVAPGSAITLTTTGPVYAIAETGSGTMTCVEEMR